MKTTPVITLLATCLTCGAAFAAQTGQSESSTGASETPAIHQKFLKLDKNKDGYIEHSEAKPEAALARDFAKVAKHGQLNEAEFSAWEAQHAAKAKTTARTEHSKLPAQTMHTGTTGKPGAGGAYK
jgi:hypothetical protein